MNNISKLLNIIKTAHKKAKTFEEVKRLYRSDLVEFELQNGICRAIAKDTGEILDIYTYSIDKYENMTFEFKMMF